MISLLFDNGGYFFIRRPATFAAIFQVKPTTSDHINMKYMWGPHGKQYWDPTLITYRDLQKVYTLNKYNFSIFICYKETMKILVTHINYTF